MKTQIVIHFLGNGVQLELDYLVGIKFFHFSPFFEVIYPPKCNKDSNDLITEDLTNPSPFVLGCRIIC